MPEIGRIQSTNFQALLTSLGIVRNDVPFALRSEVTPVVLVGGTVSFVAAPTPPYDVTSLFSLGVQVAPVINTVLADTGQLPVGAYTLKVFLYADEGARWSFEWRDVPNTATLFSQEFRTDVGSPGVLVFDARFNVQNANERFRVLNTVAGGALTRYQASIFAQI